MSHPSRRGRSPVRTTSATLDPLAHLIYGREVCTDVERHLARQLGVPHDDPGLTFAWHAAVTAVGYDDGRGVQMPWTHTHPDGHALRLPEGCVRLLCIAEHTTTATNGAQR